MPLDLIIGIGFLLSGVVMLWQLPGYQRRLEAGENKRDKSRPSFKQFRLGAIAVLLGGVAIFIGRIFDLF